MCESFFFSLNAAASSCCPLQKRKSSGAKKKAGGKSKKAKKVKSGEKRSPTSYICFCNEVRDSVKKETPEMAQKDLLRKCGEMWQALGEAGQAKYKKQAEELKKVRESLPAAVVVYDSRRGWSLYTDGSFSIYIIHFQGC